MPPQLLKKSSTFRSILEKTISKAAREMCMFSLSELDDALDLISEHMERLFSYPDWLPIERYEILHYCHQFKVKRSLCMSTMNQGSSEPILFYAPGCHSKANLIGSMVSNILEEKNKNSSIGTPMLCKLGESVKGVLVWLYGLNDSITENNCGLSRAGSIIFSDFDFDKKKFESKISSTDREICVGLESEARDLLERLTSITVKHLQVISIVGMAGIGKTTLARKVYHDPLIVYHFYVRAWVSISQVYRKRDLFLGILSSIIELTDEVSRMSSSELAEVLYRGLKGQRYLIVLDDIWNIEAWEDIKRSFPNENNGSKIMLTTRLRDVALHAQVDKNPLFLPFLTEEESWDLLQKKVFITGECPISLNDLGKEITRKCQGLPLAIVVIAGVLKNNFQTKWWEQVAASVCGYISSNPEQYMDTLALSYNYLPQHLKPCLLYFGVFPEDHEIPVRKLIWLWVAEGFICQIGRKSLEDVAKDYLMDLLKRSLILVAKKGSDGRIKTCRIHDLLRDLCLRKAEEDKFSPKLCRYMKQSYSCDHCFSSYPHPLTITQLGLGVDSVDISSKISTSPGSSLSCFASVFCKYISNDISMSWEASEVLRALDLSSVQLCIFPSELLELVHLRYLELRLTHGSPPQSISKLIALETLIILSRRNTIIPENMWKMIKLRHLRIRSGENQVNYTSIEKEPDLLENLQTMSLVSPSRSCERILARTPNLGKLGLCGPLVSKLGDLKFPDLGLLQYLERSKLLNTTPINGPRGVRPCNPIMFPERLKRLTISNTVLEWKEAWIFEIVPNLEVLKLKLHAFVGQEWETMDGVFPRLKFLKLEKLDIVNWRAYRDHFPMLERLVVHGCPSLSEIPSSLGDILTLEWIELIGCNESAMNSARDIQEEQEDNGNDWLKILISPSAISSNTPEKQKC